MSAIDGTSSGPVDTFPGLFAGLVQDLADVTVVDIAGGSEYRRGDRAFAATEERAAELRLHPEVAQAAQRTSHTTPSKRGPGWVRFEPPSVDGFALDRAGAWFLSAWRAAER